MADIPTNQYVVIFLTDLVTKLNYFVSEKSRSIKQKGNAVAVVAAAGGD